MLANNISELFINQVEKRNNNVAFEYRIRRTESYRTITWHELKELVFDLAYGLIQLGLRKNDNVAIMSETRYEWSVSDLAILSSGGVVVPIYPTLSDSGVKYILNNSQSAIVIAEDKGLLQKIRGQWDELPHVKYVIVIDDFGDLPEDDSRIISFDKVLSKGKRNHKEDPNLIQQYLNDINDYDVATIIYTSGTTGNPKGTILTHRNILSVIEVLPKIFPVSSSYKFLSFLPLSHVFERIVGLYFAISRGFTINYCSSMDQIGLSLKDSGANVMLVVPRILEKISAKLKQEFNTLPARRKKLIDMAFAVSQEKNKLEQDHNCFTLKYLFVLFKWLFADKFVLRKIRHKMAPKLKYFISGGAPLSSDLAGYFNALGIPIIEGYGLTETTAPACTNSIQDRKIGTVGKPLPGVEIKIADDGEILVKGINIFKEYYKDPEKTKQAFTEDGWFKTGDVGLFDQEGYLKITDRKKDIIVSSSGKNIAPQNIENAVKLSPFVSNIVVIGDRRKYLSALVTLDLSIVDYALSNKLINNTVSMSDLVQMPQIIKFIEDELKQKTSMFSDYEQIRKFTILPHDFEIENGEITPTLKVRRSFVEKKYKELIDKMYV